MSSRWACQKAEIASLDELRCVPDGSMLLGLKLCPEFMTVSGGFK